jgi:hypothetical protein
MEPREAIVLEMTPHSGIIHMLDKELATAHKADG